MISSLGSLLYIFLIFFDVFARMIPGLNYFDEIVLAFLVVIVVIKKFLKHDQNNYLIGTIILLISIIGIASNYVSSTYLGAVALVKDFILTFKYCYRYGCCILFIQRKI